MSKIVLIFFLIATFYSSVGFGGGSSYLALLAYLEYDPVEIRTIGLLCNIIVVAGSSIRWHMAGYLELSWVLPMVIWSVPLAFLGGLTRLNEITWFVILGSVLVLSSLLMIWQSVRLNTGKRYLKNRNSNGFFSSIVGAGVGYLSGLVGIGGGIFLAPMLHLIQWDTSKVIAASSSFFILVNSIAGLLGLSLSHGLNFGGINNFWLIVGVGIGGQLGVFLSLLKINAIWIKRLTAILVLFVGLRILWQNL